MVVGTRGRTPIGGLCRSEGRLGGTGSFCRIVIGMGGIFRRGRLGPAVGRFLFVGELVSGFARFRLGGGLVRRNIGWILPTT